MTTRKVVDSMTRDHGTVVKVKYVLQRSARSPYWKRVDVHCSGCLNRHDPQDCPHKG